MLIRDGFPLCAKEININVNWNSTTNDSVDFMGALIQFNNVNMTTAGSIKKESTGIAFNPIDPIPWSDSIPSGVTDVWETPEIALNQILSLIYESDEHQYRLGTKPRPEPTE